VGPATDERVLEEFCSKVKPAGPGWRRVRETAGIPEEEASPDNIPLALLGWFAGCTSIWSALFAVGNVLYGREGMAAFLGGVCLVRKIALVQVFRRVWA